MKATLVPTRRMKSSIDLKQKSDVNIKTIMNHSFTGSSPRSRLLITKKRSSHGVIIILADYPCSLLSLISHHTSHIFCDADDDDDADDDGSHQTSGAPGRDL